MSHDHRHDTLPGAVKLVGDRNQVVAESVGAEKAAVGQIAPDDRQAVVLLANGTNLCAGQVLLLSKHRAANAALQLASLDEDDEDGYAKILGVLGGLFVNAVLVGYHTRRLEEGDER